MSRMIFAPLVVLASAGLASATVGSSYVTDKCYELLEGAVNEGHSHFEVAALCRARLPSNLCREGLSRLGRQPWSIESMRSACGSWEAQAVGPAPARRTQDLVEGMEYTMDKKHELGICTDLSFTECLQFKAHKYPGIVENVTRIIGEISADASAQGKGPQAELPTPGADAPATTVNDEVPGTTAQPGGGGGGGGADDAVPGTTAEQVVADDEVPGTTAEPVVAEWADFRKTLNVSGRQSHLPWAVAGFAAGIGAGALLVARAIAGLRWRHDITHAHGIQSMPAE